MDPSVILQFWPNLISYLFGDKWLGSSLPAILKTEGMKCSHLSFKKVYTIGKSEGFHSRSICMCCKLIWYIDKSVLVENRPLVNLVRNYVRDTSDVYIFLIFSLSSQVKISMTSFPALTLSFVQKYSCPYNKKKTTRWLEEMNFIF